MKLTIKETVIFGMLGGVIFALKAVMEVLPNIHLVGVFIVALTVVYRKKALYPIYTFVFINGIVSGFDMWWIPYLYIWLPLWGATMLLPKKMPQKIMPFAYMTVCALHGFLYGTIYAPAQALFFGLDLNGTITWIIAGLPFDFIHGISNFICGLLIFPIINILKSSDRYLK